MKILLTNDILLSNARKGTTIGGFFMERKVNVVEDLDGNNRNSNRESAQREL